MNRKAVRWFLLVSIPLPFLLNRSSIAERRGELAPFVEASALRSDRPFEVRLSGGFSYRPLAQTFRGDASESPATSLDVTLMTAAATIQDAAVMNRGPQTLHAVGIAQLSLLHVESAIESLEEALLHQTQKRDHAAAIRESANTTLLSDLAAAYFVRSRKMGRARDLMMAAECAVRASRHDRTNAEAWWNAAVIFEAMSARDVARAMWLEFLELDTESGWATEARGRIRALSIPSAAQRWNTDRQRLLTAANAGNADLVSTLVRQYPEQARTLVEEDMLGEWADAQIAGDVIRPVSILRAATVIADAVVAISHDSLARDSVAAVLRDARSSALIRGHRAYLVARRLYKSGQHPQAEPMLAAAAADLKIGESPLAFRAAAFGITAKHYLGHSAGALDRGRALVQELGDSVVAYPVAAGQLRWTCGLAAASLGLFDEALHFHRAALQNFERTRETSNLAGLVQVLSSDYRAVGDLESAWSYQIESFRFASEHASFERAQIVFGGGALFAQRDGYVMVSDQLQRAVLARARESRQSIFICDALIRRAETLATLGNARDAQSVLAQALLEWEAVVDTAIKGRLRADLEMTRATVAAALPAWKRLSELNKAMESITSTNSRTRIARILLLRARAWRDTGDAAAAERDLLAGIAEVERQRERMTSTESRSTFLDTAADLYNELTQIHLARGQTAEALGVLERRRARWILDRYQGDGDLETANVDTLDVLRSHIPSGVVIVSYAVSDRTVDAWITTRTTVKHVVAGHPETIGMAVSSWRDIVLKQNSAAVEKQRAASLFRKLIEPLRGEFAGAHTLVFVPDRFLNGVSFAALYDGRTGRYLLETHSIVVAPSINLFVRCLAGSRKPGADSSVLIIANPALGSEGESLPSLTGADEEAARIVSMYPQASILRGHDATAERFLRDAPKASLIHVAAHGVLNDVRPEYSALVFAPGETQASSQLHARDIYRMSLHETRLVVLASCESAGGNMKSDAPLSLATSFIAAGVPTVIASLWPVDDDASPIFFGDIYRNLRDGMTTAMALREAQITAIRSGNVPKGTWAAYQVIGGDVGNQ